jgi:hypothetical protein
MAPVNALLDACPPALREALLLACSTAFRALPPPEQPRALAPRPAGVWLGRIQHRSRKDADGTRDTRPALSHTVGWDTPALLEQTIGDNLDATVARVPDRDALVDRASGVR